MSPNCPWILNLPELWNYDLGIIYVLLDKSYKYLAWVLVLVIHPNMWVLFSIVDCSVVGVFDSLAGAERAKGGLIVKHNCGTSDYVVREMVANKIYE
jgi:hypothetical protein